MTSNDYIVETVNLFFPRKGETRLVNSYDLTTLDLENKATQVRDIKNRAPKDHARRYAEQMAHVPFPPIVVTEDGYLLDGHTRIAACALRKQSIFPAVILNINYEQAGVTERARLNALTATLNAANGNPLAQTEARRSVRDFLTFGFKTEKIAQHLGVSSSVVSSVRRQVIGEEKLVKADIPLDAFNDTQKVAFGHGDVLALNDEPFRRLAKLSRAAGLKPGEITALAKQIKDAGSDGAALEVLDRALNDNGSRIEMVKLTGNGKPSPVIEFRKYLGGIHKFEGKESSLLEIDPAQVEDYRAVLAKAMAVIARVQTLQEV